jgi:hypothetical protein
MHGDTLEVDVLFAGTRYVLRSILAGGGCGPQGTEGAVRHEFIDGDTSVRHRPDSRCWPDYDRRVDPLGARLQPDGDAVHTISAACASVCRPIRRHLYGRLRQLLRLLVKPIAADTLNKALHWFIPQQTPAGRQPRARSLPATPRVTKKFSSLATLITVPASLCLQR